MTDSDNWNSCLRGARYWLEINNPAYAVLFLCLALRHANRLSPAHRRVTMRAMNWTRAAARVL